MPQLKLQLIMFQEMLPIFLSSAPRFFKGCSHFIQVITPLLMKVLELCQLLWKKLEPYHPEEFLPALAGLVVAFFGGHFLTTIAAVEAFRLSGYTRTMECFKKLYENYKVVAEANERDNLVDDDGNGIADVEEISTQDLARRKMRVVLISMDPAVVSDALAGIYSGLFGVVATLKVQFARTITLGASIGDFIYKGLNALLTPTITAMTPEEYRKWIDPCMHYGCKTVGVSLAWTIQRFISAFHSAVRGGDLFARGLCKFLLRRGVNSPLQPGSFLFNVLAGATGVLGFYWQASSWFSLPFPLNIILLPIRFVEWILVYFVAIQ